MIIKKMTATHIPRIALLERECFSSPRSERQLLDELNNEAAFFVCAIDGSQILGYAGMHIVLGECYIDNIAVFEIYRRKGVGRALTETLIYEFRELQAHLITLEVRRSNTVAISLYKNLGFVVEGERKNFYVRPAEDALIMTLRRESQSEYTRN